MKNPYILGDLFAMIAIDARTMSIALNFNINRYQEEAENCIDKALKARDIGVYFKFSHEVKYNWKKRSLPHIIANF